MLKNRRQDMKRLILSSAGAALAIVALAATVAAAGPSPSPAGDQVRSREVLPTILGLTHQQVMDLRHDGLTLAQIAERQSVDPQKLVDALAAQWSGRIDVRVANGALTASEATVLKAQVAVRAKAMVNQAAPGGMQGAAGGAGHGRMGAGGGGAGMGARNGAGNPAGTCDGTGPQGPPTP
jgi:hypothetical protein